MKIDEAHGLGQVTNPSLSIISQLEPQLLKDRNGVMHFSATWGILVLPLFFINVHVTSLNVTDCTSVV